MNVRRRVRALAVALAGAVGASALLIAAPSGAAVEDGMATELNGVRLEATFNDPYVGMMADSKSASYPGDNTILYDYQRLVDSVPEGSVIRAGIRSASSTGNDVNNLTGPGKVIAESFQRAIARGATVKAVQNAAHKDNPAAKKIASMLGSNHKWCENETPKGTRNTACLSNAEGASMHAKYALFSRAKDRSGKEWTHVVWISSANFDNNAGGKFGYNNAITVYGDQELYSQLLNGLWGPMFDSSFAIADFYQNGRGAYSSDASRVTVYASPETARGVDLFTDRLDPFIPEADCDVYVQHVRFTRASAADRLKDMAAGGCTVKALTYKQPQGGTAARQADDYLAPGVKSIFMSQARMTMRCAPIHDKSILVRARTNSGGALRYFVFAGSHNLTKKAQTTNDELIIKVESKDLYVAFREHFRTAWVHSDPVTGRCIF